MNVLKKKEKFIQRTERKEEKKRKRRSEVRQNKTNKGNNYIMENERQVIINLNGALTVNITVLLLADHFYSCFFASGSVQSESQSSL